MKWLLLLVSATTAVTVFSNEDNIAMESQGGNIGESAQPPVVVQQQAESRRSNIDRLAEERRRKTYAPNDPLSTQPTYFNIQGDGGKTLGYSSYIHHSEEVDAIKQGSSVDIKKVAPKSTVHVEMYHDQQEQQQQTVPQHQVQQQQIDQKEAAHTKLKNKPPKFYQEAVSNYKKVIRPTYKVPFETPALKPFSTPKSMINSPIKLFPAKRNQYSLVRSDGENIPPVKGSIVPNSHKAESYGGSHSILQSPISGGQSAEHNNNHNNNNNNNGKRQLHHSNNQTPWKSLSDNVEIAGSEEVKFKPKLTRRPKEVGTEYTSSQQKVFVKDDSSSFVSGTAFGTDKLKTESFNGERFKAERFDHEKALKGSTPFNIEHVVNFNSFLEGSHKPVQFSLDSSSSAGINSLEPSTVSLKDWSPQVADSSKGLGNFGSLGDFGSSLSSANTPSIPSVGSSDGDLKVLGGLENFHLPSSDFEMKVVDFNSIGSSRAPIQFSNQPAAATEQTPSNFKFHSELPVMTEEEFVKTFGQIPNKKDIKKPEFKVKTIPNRVPFDYRSLPKSQFTLKPQLNSPQFPNKLHSNQVSHNSQSQLSLSSHLPQFSQNAQSSQGSLSSHLPQFSHNSQLSQGSLSSHLPQLSHNSQLSQGSLSSHLTQLSHNSQLSQGSLSSHLSQSSHNSESPQVSYISHSPQFSQSSPQFSHKPQLTHISHSSPQISHSSPQLSHNAYSHQVSNASPPPQSSQNIRLPHSSLLHSHHITHTPHMLQASHPSQQSSPLLSKPLSPQTAHSPSSSPILTHSAHSLQQHFPQFSSQSHSLGESISQQQKLQQALNFAKFGSEHLPEWAKEKHENVEVAPTFNFPGFMRKKSAQGRVLNTKDASDEQQQFSVSASYQIDRSHES